MSRRRNKNLNAEIVVDEELFNVKFKEDVNGMINNESYSFKKNEIVEINLTFYHFLKNRVELV